MAVGKPGVPHWQGPGGGQRPPGGRASGPGRPGPAAGAGRPTAPTMDEWAAAGPVGRSSRLQAALSRLLVYLLWTAIALALVLSLVNCAGSPSAAPQSPLVQTEPVPPPGGCAELVVANWLAGDTDLLDGVPGVPRSGPATVLREATATFTAAVTPGEGAWSYLIAAEVRGREDPEQPWQPAGTQFFTLTMVPSTDGSGCHGWSPAALPAQVPAPRLAGDAPSPYPVTLPSSGTELSRTMQAFFTGLLTGGEELERYVAPGVSIPAVVPPPYEQVSVTDLRARAGLPDEVPVDGTVAQLLVSVSTGKDHLPLVYPLTATVRGGRWEVVAIDPLVGTTALLPTAPARSTAPTVGAEPISVDGVEAAPAPPTASPAGHPR